MVMGTMLRFRHEVSHYDLQVDVGKLIEGRYKKLTNAMETTDLDAVMKGAPGDYLTGTTDLHVNEWGGNGADRVPVGLRRDLDDGHRPRRDPRLHPRRPSV